MNDTLAIVPVDLSANDATDIVAVDPPPEDALAIVAVNPSANDANATVDVGTSLNETLAMQQRTQKTLTQAMENHDVIKSSRQECYRKRRQGSRNFTKRHTESKVIQS